MSTTSDPPLPKILAGPILRRTDESGAWVWLATSQPASVTATAYDARPASSPAARVERARGMATSMAFGEALHVTVVGMLPLAPATALESNALFEYDLETTLADGTVFKLDTAELQGTNRIAYPPYALPTFFVPKRTSVVNLLHGSCRKAHGSDDDAFAAADLILRDHVGELAKRPSALFLTGDQIYADDVHDSLTTAVDELGRRVVGFEEVVRIEKSDSAIPFGTGIHGISALIGGMRGHLLADVFTPNAKHDLEKSDAKNHLIGFGDYAAMHLLHWNPSVWPPKVGDESKDVKAFRKRLTQVRRALANIPTYMMLDDHEITDDWLRTKAWQERAERSALGRRVIANGLVAFWAFQACGNDPGAAVPEFAKLASAWLSDPADIDREALPYEQAALEFRDFSFVANTHPRAVVVDMRTTRGPDKGELVDGRKPDPDAPCEVLGTAGVAAFVKRAREACKEKELLVVVAPAPVVGFAQWERPQEVIPVVGLFDADVVDLESWHGNPASYHRFLLAIAEEIKPGACLFLSGDVHFGHISKAVLTAGATPGSPARQIGFTQFTSSALKHRHSAFKRGLLNVADRFVPDLDPEWIWKARPGTTLPTVRPAINEERAKTIAENGGPPDYTHRSYGVGETMCSASPLLITASNMGQLEMDGIAPDTLARFTHLGPDLEQLAQRELYLDWRPTLRPRDQ